MALKAKGLNCTGCVLSEHLDKDLKVTGSVSIGAGKNGPLVITSARQLQRARLETAEKAPYTCDANETGGLYFDTKSRSIMVCDGTAWSASSREPVVACSDPNADLTNAAYKHYGSGNCSPHGADQTWMSKNDAYSSGQFGWHDSCGKTGPNPFATIAFPKPMVVQSFRVLLHSNPPKKCNFQGSDDTTNGLNGAWTTLYGPFDCPSGKEGQWGQRRSFANSHPFMAYRLHCPGSPAFALYEWEFFCGK